MLKVYWYLVDGTDEPLGVEEYWLVAAPRHGDTVCVVYYPIEQPGTKCRVVGKVVDLQWTVEKRDDNNEELPDWCTVDIWLDPFPCSDVLLVEKVLVMDPLLSRITIDPTICHGKPCIRGLRYPVEWLLELLSSGMSQEEVLADYSDLERDDLRAAMAFAAKLTKIKSLGATVP